MNVSSVNCTVHCSHQLEGIVPEGHPCSRLHGHSYQISVEMSYQNNPTALLMDFGVVKKLIRDKYDHRHLNDVMALPPTAENLGEEIYLLLRTALPVEVDIRHVTVAETENNISTFIPEETEEEE